MNPRPGSNCVPASALSDLLRIDAPHETQRIIAWIRETVRGLRRRGVVLGVSGGVDSAVCASLAVRALGPERVRALYTPGTSSSSEGGARAHELCRRLGIPLRTESIVPALRALGCYERRTEAIRSVFPGWQPHHRFKIVIAGDVLDRDRVNVFDLVVETDDGSQRRARLPLPAYLGLVAATNCKQRMRKLIEYENAERENLAVVGTPNRLEYQLGFFVRGGDGVSDLEPIAHLYKTQVYELAAHLDVPSSIRDAVPSTETYSLPQTQEEFFFALPLRQLDLLLAAYERGVTAERVARELSLEVAQVERVFGDLGAKRRHAAQLHQAPVLVEPLQ